MKQLALSLPPEPNPVLPQLSVEHQQELLRTMAELFIAALLTQVSHDGEVPYEHR